MKTGPKALLVSTLLLSACASHTHQMKIQDGRGSVIGSFTHEGQAPPSMSVDLDGKRYEATDFSIHRVENLAELSNQYGIASKHYDRITSGLDMDHRKYSAKPELVASDGSKLTCTLTWKLGRLPAGICELDSGKKIKLASE